MYLSPPFVWEVLHKKTMLEKSSGNNHRIWTPKHWTGINCATPYCQEPLVLREESESGKRKKLIKTVRATSNCIEVYETILHCMIFIEELGCGKQGKVRNKWQT